MCDEKFGTDIVLRFFCPQCKLFSSTHCRWRWRKMIQNSFWIFIRKMLHHSHFSYTCLLEYDFITWHICENCVERVVIFFSSCTWFKIRLRLIMKMLLFIQRHFNEKYIDTTNQSSNFNEILEVNIIISAKWFPLGLFVPNIIHLSI